MCWKLWLSVFNCLILKNIYWISIVRMSLSVRLMSGARMMNMLILRILLVSSMWLFDWVMVVLVMLLIRVCDDDVGRFRKNVIRF